MVIEIGKPVDPLSLEAVLAQIKNRAKRAWQHPISGVMDLDQCLSDLNFLSAGVRVHKAQLDQFLKGLGVTVPADAHMMRPEAFEDLGLRVRNELIEIGVKSITGVKETPNG